MTPSEECREAVQILRGLELDAEGIVAVELLDTTANLLDGVVQAVGDHFPVTETFAGGFAELVERNPIYGPPLALAREIRSQHQSMQGGEPQ